MRGKRFIFRKWLWLTIRLVAGLIILAGCQTTVQTTTTPPTNPSTATSPAAAVAAPATPTAEPANPPTPAPDPTQPAASPTPQPAVPTPTAAEVPSCQPTPPDALGPFYVPGAPERSSVGQGHLLNGVVRSAEGCAPIPGAQLEFWLAGPDGQYGNAYRATLAADAAGAYRFESNFPPPYSGRPSHIHLRVTAAGYQPLVTQYYPAQGQSEGSFDLVLRPAAESSSQSTEPGQTASNIPDPTLFEGAWQDRSLFEPGLIESERAILAELPGASIYHLELDIGADLVHLTGRQEVLYTNQEDGPLTEVYFRLFPNLAGGSSTIANLTVNGAAVKPGYELANSAMRVPLSPVLQPGEQVVLGLEFNVEVPTSEGGNYGTFAYLDDTLALAHFYPMIAVYDDEGWNIEIAPQIGDIIYADSSFYLARITAPVELTLATSGLIIERVEQDGRQVVTVAAGPMRDFYLAASDRYTVTSQSVGEVAVNSYAPAELSAGSEMALSQAVQALQSFNERFGPYPFTEFDLVTTPNLALGVEYPGIVVIRGELYGADQDNRLLEAVVAHEVAHQWFYSVVGNDQVDEPWVDEALAQYATLLYFLDVYGPPGGAAFRGSLERRWTRVDGVEIPIGLPVRDYTVQEYSAIVYGRGPLFLETLAESMGQESFATFLQEYYRRHQWGIATTASFKDMAETHCSCDLTPLFEAWVYDTPAP